MAPRENFEKIDCLRCILAHSLPSVSNIHYYIAIRVKITQIVHNMAIKMG